MATRIRLQRHGKKNKAFFHLVAADSRAKRDGKFIEKLGTYNPNTNPATIDINFEKTLTKKEAQILKMLGKMKNQVVEPVDDID
jgi:ribosomal protein S16